MATQRRKRNRQINRELVCLGLACFWGSAHGAGLSGNVIEEITVFGSQNVLLGNPVTATEGVVLSHQLELRPISRIGELMEFVPGMVATQHSGEGKANQYFLRGFNLDHGTDFAMTVDGMPVNMPSHAHGQGYADINFLLPEMTQAMLYRKGPYYAAVGDFSTAGSADFVYRDFLDTGLVSLTAGENEFSRLFLGNSATVGEGQLTGALAVTRYAGPWQRDQNLAQTNALLKYFSEGSDSRWSVTAALYDNEWDASDQIPLRTVASGQIGELGFIDPTVGGDSHRHSLSWQREQVLGAGNLFLDAYLIDYQLDLFSNFTYFLDNPTQSDQFHQADHRTITGFNTRYVQPLQFGEIPTELTLGVQYRHDDADVGLFKTNTRVPFLTVRDDTVKESSLGGFVSVDQRWNSWFRSVLAMRLDHYNFDVDSNTAVNSGDTSDTLASPKLNLVFAPWSSTELFLSHGRGFHSNDARGTTITIDPVSGDPV
ncbi:MAG: TonB-dependent receptor, partial [Pseudohongiellaceae bacterium]